MQTIAIVTEIYAIKSHKSRKVFYNGTCGTHTHTKWIVQPLQTSVNSAYISEQTKRKAEKNGIAVQKVEDEKPFNLESKIIKSDSRI